MACADSSASIPPIPAPCAIVANWLMPIIRSLRAVSADTRRTASASNLDDFPNPTTATLAAGILPSVWMMVTSPCLPVISPSWMSCEMPPSNALSTAPVAPLGWVTPSNRLTTTASAFQTLMSPAATSSFIAYVPFSAQGWKVMGVLYAGLL